MTIKESGVIALLPLKAHSERIPSKNFRDLRGKPLFRWVLDTLLSVPDIRRVVIDTDAREKILAGGVEPSARVVLRDRREELRGDGVSMNRILADAVRAEPADVYLQTHATAPLLSAGTIGRAIRRYREVVARGEGDSLIGVLKHQKFFYRSDGSAVGHDPVDLPRTQDLDPLFEDAGSLYLFSAESFSKRQSRIGKKPTLFEVPKLEAIDIDDQDDWRLAEALLANVPDG